MGSLKKASANLMKVSTSKLTEESSVYAHADENTNAAYIISNRL
jgi:hypothetical protein